MIMHVFYSVVVKRSAVFTRRNRKSAGVVFWFLVSRRLVHRSGRRHLPVCVLLIFLIFFLHLIFQQFQSF